MSNPPSTAPEPAPLRWLRAGANHVLVVMMGAMFVAFILQIYFRYVANKPVAWTEEICVLAWIWGILWGAAFVMSNREDIRFDVLTTHLTRSTRRWLTVVASGVAVAILLLSLPSAWSYVTFMKVERSAALGIRMDHFFAIYVAFVVATVVRHSYLFVQALRNQLIEDGAPAVAGTAA